MERKEIFDTLVELELILLDTRYQQIMDHFQVFNVHERFMRGGHKALYQIVDIEGFT